MERHQFNEATKRARRRRTDEPIAISARYDQNSDRVIIALSTGYDIAFSPRQAEGLEMAKPGDLDTIEITPSGLGLHFPKLDADLYLPSLMQGVFGSKQWIAAQLGASGGKAKSKAKTKAARVNGRLGGRPTGARKAGRGRRRKGQAALPPTR
jgi:hypothetical protein